MRLSVRLSALIAIALSALLAACGGGSAPGSSGQPAPAPAVAERLPRERSLSAADLSPDQASDICAEFPAPSDAPFAPGAGSPLAILPGEHMLGRSDAPVTIILYHELSCDDCPEIVAALEGLVEADPEVRVVYRHYAVGEDGRIAAELTESAYEQGGEAAFWQMVDILEAEQTRWKGAEPDTLRDLFEGYAEDAGLDAAQVRRDLAEETYRARVEFSAASARQVGVPASPALFVNDLLIQQPPLTVEEMALMATVVRVRARYAVPPPQVIDPERDYAAWILTEKGTIAVDLFADLAPETVNNFAYLACSGYYDGLTFHRVVPGFVAQAGDPTGTGIGGPGYTIADEFAGSALRFDREGWLSMAHTSAPNSAGGQFFITLGPADHLNGAFTIFGQVVEGMAVAHALSPRDPASAAAPGDAIETILVREVRP